MSAYKTNVYSKNVNIEWKQKVGKYELKSLFSISQQYSLSTVASMFQNLQNLANMQQSMPMSQQQMSQQMSQLAANLQGLTSMPSNSVINSPLNLSVSAPGKYYIHII